MSRKNRIDEVELPLNVEETDAFHIIEDDEVAEQLSFDKPEWFCDVRPLTAGEKHKVITYRRNGFKFCEVSEPVKNENGSYSVSIKEPGRWFSVMGLMDYDNCKFAEILYHSEMILVSNEEESYELYNRMIKMKEGAR